MLKFQIPVEDWPINDSRTGWSKILNISPTTLDRSEKQGKLKGAFYVNARTKLYAKENIMEWLGLKPKTEASVAPVKKGIVQFARSKAKVR
jgi:hypothetical protein